jgi:hypothetical protein
VCRRSRGWRTGCSDAAVGAGTGPGTRGRAIAASDATKRDIDEVVPFDAVLRVGASSHCVKVVTRCRRAARHGPQREPPPIARTTGSGSKKAAAIWLSRLRIE